MNKAGDTPLSLACANGHFDTVKYLGNEHHCDPRSEHCMAHGLLHHSVTSRTYTGTVNQAGDTPLSLAYKGGHWEVVKYLAITYHCDTKSKPQVHFNNLIVHFCCINCYSIGLYQVGVAWAW